MNEIYLFDLLNLIQVNNFYGGFINHLLFDYPIDFLLYLSFIVICSHFVKNHLRFTFMGLSLNCYLH